MNNRRTFIKSALVASGTALLASCESSEEVEDLYQNEDPFSYAENSSFLTKPERGFDYYKFNGSDYDGQKRSETSMNRHKPTVRIAGNKKEFIINFGSEDTPSTHKNGHYWAWVEITDRLNNVHTVAFPEPAKYDEFYGDEGKDFQAYIQTPEALDGWIRLRACSKPYGVFVNYAKIEA